MQCSSCGQHTEEGKFCTNCGTELSNEESAATAEPVNNANAVPESQPPAQGEQPNTQQEPNEVVEKIKEISNNFGHFFLTLIKKPSNAKKANHNDWISGVITMTLYSLLFALGYYLAIRSLFKAMSFGFGDSGDISFMDGFLWPFLKVLVLFAVIVALTFAALKLATSDYSIQDTIGKYGAYLIPFSLLFVAGFLLTLIGLNQIGIAAIFVSVIGVLFVAPTMILLEETSTGIDRIYLLILVYVVNFFVFSFILKSLADPIINSVGGMFGNILGGL